MLFRSLFALWTGSLLAFLLTFMNAFECFGRLHPATDSQLTWQFEFFTAMIVGLMMESNAIKLFVLPAVLTDVIKSRSICCDGRLEDLRRHIQLKFNSSYLLHIPLCYIYYRQKRFPSTILRIILAYVQNGGIPPPSQGLASLAAFGGGGFLPPNPMNKVDAAGAVAFLNSLLEFDKQAIKSLIDSRVFCNKELQNHPTVQVGGIDGTQVGLLGILNGMFGCDDKGNGYILAVYDDERNLIKFSLTDAVKDG